MKNRQHYSYEKNLTIPAKNISNVENQADKSAPADADIWDLRYPWETTQNDFLQQCDLGLVKHPDKMFVGWVQRSFDWLGAWFTERGPTSIAPRAVKNYHEKLRQLYEQTQHWLKEKQACRVSDCQTQWNRRVAGLRCSRMSALRGGVMSIAFVIPTLSHGGAASWPATIETGSTSTSVWSASNNMGWTNTLPQSYASGCATFAAVFVGASANASVNQSRDCLTTANMAWSADGRYYGYKIADGVILAIVSSTMTGVTTVSQGPGGTIKPGTTATPVFGSNGGYGGGGYGTPADKAWSSGIGPYSNTFTHYRKEDTYSISGSGSMVLSVDPSTPPGSYTLPQLTLAGPLPSSGVVISPSTPIEIVRPSLACTVLAPAVVDFGEIHLSEPQDGDILAYASGDLTVSCSGGDGSGYATSVKVTGDTGRYTNTLKMNMTNATQVAPAEIRGFIGPGNPSVGICNGNANYPGWIQFTSNGRVVKVDDLSAGLNVIPYSFTVCSNGGRVLGKASAMATVTINWG